MTLPDGSELIPPDLHAMVCDPKKLQVKKKRGAEYRTYPPGRCFYEAGWHFEGITKSGKHILVKLP